MAGGITVGNASSSSLPILSSLRLTEMPARTNKVETATHAQPTPAPLLSTKKGQYPNLPHQLAIQAIPANTTPLLQLPLSEWYTLNPNKSLTATKLFETLTSLPHDPNTTPTVAAYFGNTNCITFLSPRPPSSMDFMTTTPGKSLSITTKLPSHTLTVTPSEIAELHRVLSTDFVIAPSDHPPLDTSPSTTNLQKRLTRGAKLQQAFIESVPTNAIASVGGGDSLKFRREAAKTAFAATVIGYSIDGLYTGESPTTRVECIKAAVEALPEKGITLLTGGSGSPWEVLSAVEQGIDIVAGDYPFETASTGKATDLKGGRTVNVRDRGWMTCKEVLLPGCGCFVCRQGFSKGYLRHLFEVHEIMAVSFVAAHNLWDYFSWFESLRCAIRDGRFAEFVEKFERQRELVRVDTG